MPTIPTWFWFALVMGYICGALVNMAIADQKHRNILAALGLSVVIGPLLMWMYLVAVPPLEPRPWEREEQERPSGYRRERP